MAGSHPWPLPSDRAGDVARNLRAWAERYERTDEGSRSDAFARTAITRWEDAVRSHWGIPRCGYADDLIDDELDPVTLVPRWLASDAGAVEHGEEQLEGMTIRFPRRWLERSCSALYGWSLRGASHRPAGRGSLHRRLYSWEQHIASLPPTRRYDLSPLRRELGLHEDGPCSDSGLCC